MRVGWIGRLGVVAGVMLVALEVAGAERRDGRVLFSAYCEACHGSEARGDGPDASLFSPRPRNLRTGILGQHPTDALVERIRHGRPLGLAHDAEALRARAEDTEMLVKHLERLPEIAWREVERGQEIYVDRCEICHGPFGHPSTVLPLGVATPPRDLSDPAWQRATSDATLVDRFRRGHRAMPAVPSFDDLADRDAVVSFVRVLSPGYEHYSRFCASCHGDDGRGPGVDWASARRPTVVFDRAYFAKKDPEALRKDAWHMLRGGDPQMPHMSRVLRPSDVRTILDYLRSLPVE
jgi:mono/diheme cytochrome c family protein